MGCRGADDRRGVGVTDDACAYQFVYDECSAQHSLSWPRPSSLLPSSHSLTSGKMAKGKKALRTGVAPRLPKKKIGAKGGKQSRKPVTPREVQIIKNMKKLIHLPTTKIAIATERNKSTIDKILKNKPRTFKRGAPKALEPKDVSRLVKTLKSMVQTAKARYEVTLAMLKHKAKITVCDRVVRKALLSRGIKFRKMRVKPVLTKKDRKLRYRFAGLNRNKTRSWWLRKIQLHWDLKNFPVYVNRQGREYAARREVRGVYRKIGQGLDEGYVAIDKSLRYNPGVKAARIAACVGKGRVRVWHEVGKKWNGRVAAETYSGPVAQALRRGWPGKRKFLMLEDNDPTGFKSRKGEAAKAKEKIEIFEIPKRSPDLNVCDYALWKAVSRKMRKQERSFPASKRETRDEYLKRLKKAATSLPKSFVDKAIGDMAERCRRLYNARGGHFEEGGLAGV